MAKKKNTRKKQIIKLERVGDIKQDMMIVGNAEWDFGEVYGLPYGFIYYDLTTKTLYIGEEIEYDLTEVDTDRPRDRFCVEDAEYIAEIIEDNRREVEKELTRLSKHVILGRELNEYIKNKKKKLEDFGILGVEFSQTIMPKGLSGVKSGIRLMTISTLRFLGKEYEDSIRDDFDDILSHYLGSSIEDDIINKLCYDAINKLLKKDAEDFETWIKIYDILFNENKPYLLWYNSGFEIVEGGIKFYGEEWLNDIGRELFEPLLDENDVLHFDSLEELSTMIDFIDGKNEKR